MTTFTLSEDQLECAESLVEPTLNFLATQAHPLSDALVRYRWTEGPAADVITALADYQNEDGGFGRGLEVDIKAPVSNPFAARLAMQAMMSVPREASNDMRAQLKTWLIDNQHEDGDWHFAPEVYQHELAPWFAEWKFPALNPACCVAGAAHMLGLTTPTMLARVAALFNDKASLEDAGSGEFYGILPYVEYIESIDVPNRNAYVDAIANGILKADTEGTYDDAQHFFDHAINGGPTLTAKLSPDLLSRWTDRLLDEPLEDGGWPTPYDPAWRPWTTASAMVTLARLRTGV